MEKGERELDIPLYCNSSYGLVIRNERARVNIPEEDQQKIIDSVTTGDHGKKKLERKQPKQAEMTEIGPTYDKPAAEADDHHLYIQGRNLVSIRGQDQSCKQPISEGSRTSLQESDILLQENPIYFAHWQQIKQTIRRGKKLKQSKHRKTECLIITMLIPAFLLTFLSILFSLLLFSSVHSQSQINLTAEEVPVFNNSSIQSQVNISFQLNTTFRILNQKLNNLSLQLNYLRIPDNNYLSLAAGSRLSGLFSKVSSIGESVEDIRVSYNSTAANRTSNLNLLAGVTVNVSDDCIVIEKSPCQIPNFGIYQCRTSNFDFIDQGRIVVNFNCYVKPTKTDIANFRGHTQTVIDINTPSNPTPDQVFEALQTAELSCFCTTFDKTQGSCNYYVKRCPYTRTSHVTFHT